MKANMPLMASAALLVILFVSGCTTQGPPAGTPGNITTFDECAAAGYPVMESYPRQCRTPGADGQTFTEIIDDGSGEEPGPIGGQRDEHGCLGPAGYSWNGTIGACIRPWELAGDEGEAARIAVAYLGQAYATTVTAVEAGSCEGCFTATIEQGEDRVRYEVTVENWAAVGKQVVYPME